jgi:predicted MPP superfamily phosphohydrolase
MGAWRRRFTRIVLTIALGLELPFGLLVGDLLRRSLPLGHAALLTVLLVLLLNGPLFYRLFRWRDEERAHPLWVWLIETPYFVHFCASLLFGPLAWVALLGVGLASWTGLLSPVPALSAYLGPLYLASLVLGAYGTLVRRFWTPVRKVEVAIAGLPPALEGYTLVQLSDVHCGPYMPRWYYRALARRASALGAHAVMLTGDMINEGSGYLDDVADFVRHLSAPDGVFASMGNHDYLGTVDGVANAMARGGATVLRNEGVVLAPARDGGLYLAAVDDTWSRRADLEATFSARPAHLPCVLLAHDPSLFPAVLARGDVDLMLSGHTHGGQMAVPFAARRWNFAALRYRYTLGAYREGRTLLYVHRGNGTSGPPARIGAAPEIALLTLKRATSSPAPPA